MKSLAPSLLIHQLMSHAQQRFDRFTHTSIADLFAPSDEFVQVSESLVDFLFERGNPCAVCSIVGSSTLIVAQNNIPS
jgi:uncharacterized protein YeaO (DUF488 family)